MRWRTRNSEVLWLSGPLRFPGYALPARPNAGAMSTTGEHVACMFLAATCPRTTKANLAAVSVRSWIYDSLYSQNDA